MLAIRISLLAATIGLLSACGGGATRPDAAADASPAKAPSELEARAKTRWDLLIAGKFAEAYDYLSPGMRAVTARDAYAASLVGRPVKWLAAEVKGKQCPDGESYCDVQVDVNYEIQSTLPGVGTLRSVGPVHERWIEIEGNWYFVPEEVTRNDRGLR